MSLFFFTCTRNGEIDSTKNVRDCLVLFACCFTASTHEEWHLKSLTKRKRTARRTDPSHWCIKHWAAENSAAVICSRGNPTIHNPKMRKTRRRGKFLRQINTFEEWKKKKRIIKIKWDEITFLVGSRKRTIESHRLNSNGRTGKKIPWNASLVSQTIKRQWHKRAGKNVPSPVSCETALRRRRFTRDG